MVTSGQIAPMKFRWCLDFDKGLETYAINDSTTAFCLLTRFKAICFDRAPVVLNHFLYSQGPSSHKRFNISMFKLPLMNETVTCQDGRPYGKCERRVMRAYPHVNS